MADIIPFPSLSEPVAFPTGGLGPELEPLSAHDLAGLMGGEEPEASLPALITALESEEDTLFEQALALVSVLRVTSPRAELEPVEARLLERMFDPGTALQRRLSIAEAFAALLGRPGHNEFLFARLQSEHAEHRRVAALALGFADNHHAFELLVGAVSDVVVEVGEAAVRALAALEHPGLAEAYGAVLASAPARPVKLAILRRLRELPADEAEPLALPFAFDSDREARLAVAQALDAGAGTGSREVLLRYLEDVDFRVRVAALGAFERAGDPADRPALLPLLEDGDPRVRRVASEAVQRLARGYAASDPAAL